MPYDLVTDLTDSCATAGTAVGRAVRARSRMGLSLGIRRVYGQQKRRQGPCPDSDEEEESHVPKVTARPDRRAGEDPDDLL
ncbi:hypothetical protein GCM10010400_08610 [Streptomyces aculeolatus]